LPVLLAVGGAALLALVRLRTGGAHFISDGALMMLALAAYKAIRPMASLSYSLARIRGQRPNSNSRRSSLFRKHCRT